MPEQQPRTVQNHYHFLINNRAKENFGVASSGADMNICRHRKTRTHGKMFSAHAVFLPIARESGVVSIIKVVIHPNANPSCT